MKTQHWSGAEFIPSTSNIIGFYGGIHPEITFNVFNSEAGGFGAISYQLRVQNAHNGWHHFAAFYSAIQGVAFVNACAKESCRPGTYNIQFHFDMIRPAYIPVSGDTNIENYYDATLRSSLLYGQDSNVYGSGNTWANGNIMDVMVFRPTLVDPTNANNFYRLWNSNSVVYDGWQPFFTGIPIADPQIVVGSDYEL